jgi:hypothetical protein
VGYAAMAVAVAALAVDSIKGFIAKPKNSGSVDAIPTWPPETIDQSEINSEEIVIGENNDILVEMNKTIISYGINNLFKS